MSKYLKKMCKNLTEVVQPLFREVKGGEKSIAYYH